MSVDDETFLCDDLLLYLLEYFEFDELFDTLTLVNTKFRALTLQLECNKFRQKIRDINVNNTTCIVTKSRKYKVIKFP